MNFLLFSLELKSTVFDKQEINNSDYETESEEEEFDDALAIPTFYKYQRIQKINEEQNRLKYIQLSQNANNAKISQTPKTNQKTAISQNFSKNAFTKLNNSNNSKILNLKKMGKMKNNVLHRPNPRKLITSNSNSNSMQKNLIITFSENRKDTLRSAVSTCPTTSKSSELSDILQRTVGGLENSKINKKNEENTCSAFKQPLKQKSLLDMLKQRKRKNSSNLEKSEKSLETQNSDIFQHNLRSRTTSVN